MVEKLFADLGPRFKARPGGYTRILRMMPRPGDSAPMALMQLVDGPAAVAAEEPTEGKKKGTRARTAVKAKSKTKAKAQAAEAAPVEAAPKKRTRKKKAAGLSGAWFCADTHRAAAGRPGRLRLRPAFR